MQGISHRIAGFLERRGLLERDAENSYLALEAGDDDAMMPLQGHSIIDRIAVGPQQGRKVFTLQKLPPEQPERLRPSSQGRRLFIRCLLAPHPAGSGAVQIRFPADLSLHAGLSTEAHQHDKLERLCR